MPQVAGQGRAIGQEIHTSTVELLELLKRQRAVLEGLNSGTDSAVEFVGQGENVVSISQQGTNEQPRPLQSEEDFDAKYARIIKDKDTLIKAQTEEITALNKNLDKIQGSMQRATYLVNALEEEKKEAVAEAREWKRLYEAEEQKTKQEVENMEHLQKRVVLLSEALDRLEDKKRSQRKENKRPTTVTRGIQVTVPFADPISQEMSLELKYSPQNESIDEIAVDKRQVATDFKRELDQLRQFMETTLASIPPEEGDLDNTAGAPKSGAQAAGNLSLNLPVTEAEKAVDSAEHCLSKSMVTDPSTFKTPDIVAKFSKVRPTIPETPESPQEFQPSDNALVELNDLFNRAGTVTPRDASPLTTARSNVSQLSVFTTSSNTQTHLPAVTDIFRKLMAEQKPKKKISKKTIRAPALPQQKLPSKKGRPANAKTNDENAKPATKKQNIKAQQLQKGSAIHKTTSTAAKPKTTSGNATRRHALQPRQSGNQHQQQQAPVATLTWV
eukprot:Clim_evm37s158 gene=Clim_evmTU37s158